MTKAPRARQSMKGEPCGLLAIPIPEVGDLRFLKLIQRFYDTLGHSGGRRILWRPIGDPRNTDSSYEKMRSNDMAVADEYSVEKFKGLIEKRGGAEHHISRECNLLARQLNVTDKDRPCVVFVVNPEEKFRPILHIPSALLKTRESQNTLGRLLANEINSEVVEDILDDGVLTPESLEEFSKKIIDIEEMLAEIIPHLPGTSIPRRAGSYAQIFGNGDDKFVDKETYSYFWDNRNEYNLIVNMVDGRIYCRMGERSRLLKFRRGILGILIDVMEVACAVRLENTESGQQCSSLVAARNAFTEGRSTVEKFFGPEVDLFKRIPGCMQRTSLWEFCPPGDFKWATVRPADDIID